MAKPENTTHIVQAAQQQCFTRSDIATTHRAFNDLQQQAGKLSNAIFQIAATAPHCSQEAFQTAWNHRQELNQIQGQLGELNARMEAMMPSASTARLSDNERTQIRGLYASGLYTQQELADQYGVSQPTIGDIVRT